MRYKITEETFLDWNEVILALGRYLNLSDEEIRERDFLFTWNHKVIETNGLTIRRISNPKEE